MKTKRTFKIGAFLLGAALCFGNLQPASAAHGKSLNNPIVFSAVVRDADGFVRDNATLTLDCRIIDRETHSLVYSETHTITADAMGQLQIPLGEGMPTYGNFLQVDFAAPLDLIVYDGEQVLSHAPLTTVPAAMYAQVADNAKTAQSIEGIEFDDEAAPDKNIIWSSEKVTQLLNNVSGDTPQTPAEDINLCLVNDAENGIYHEAIPIGSGLFANPILKVLRQDGNCDLFSGLDDGAAALKKSYRVRVMTYNTAGDPKAPKEVYIPASTAGLDIYVDNYRIDQPVTYYTHDALVFDVEFYYLGDDITPKLYVTLIRE